jgi:tetratricopeptide (TPR) repeat protein
MRQTKLKPLASLALLTILLSIALTIAPHPLLAHHDSEARLAKLYSEAQAAQERGDYRTAAARYEEIVKLRPKVAEAWANVGLMHQFLGEYELANKSFDVALRKNPRLYVPNLFLGLNLLRQQRPKEAVPYLERAERLNPHDRQAVLGLARAYEAAGDLAKANSAFFRASEIDPRDPEAWYGLGVTCLNLQNSAVEQLGQQNIGSPYARALVAEAFLEQERPNDAIHIYRKLLGARDAPPCLASGLGFAFLQQGNLSSAEDLFREEGGRHPDCLEARIGQACIAIARDDPKEAYQILRVVWEADQNFLGSNLTYLWNRLTSEQLQSFQFFLKPTGSGSSRDPLAATLVKSISIWRANPTAELKVSDLLLGNQAGGPPHHGSARGHSQTSPLQLASQGHYTECQARLESQKTGKVLSEWLLLSRCAYYAADYRSSLVASGKALELDARNLAALYWKAKAAQKLATFALLRTSAEAPDSFRAHLLLGEVYRQREEYKTAEAEFRKVLALKPDDLTARLGLARIHYANTQFPRALTELEPILKADPKNPEASFLMGEILVKQHLYPGAVPYLKNALRGQQLIVPRVHSLLATCYAAQGQIAQAISELKSALPADMDGVFHYQIYRLYRAAGDEKAAAAALERSEMLRKKTSMDQQELIQASQPR